ncbi:hypothetical protein Ddc_24666 [Ditylenchus destructor]|nr:hypothetical protein Ddc_24666 [Ditylenchus destructor]
MDKLEEIRRSERNVVAQESVASSTERLLQLSCFQVFITIIGTIALVYTLMLNRRATNAAIESCGLNVPGFYTQQSMFNPFFGDGRDPNRLTKWVLTVRWRNGGRSPALHCILGTFIAFRNLEDDVPNFVVKPEQAPNTST